MSEDENPITYVIPSQLDAPVYYVMFLLDCISCCDGIQSKMCLHLGGVLCGFQADRGFETTTDINV